MKIIYAAMSFFLVGSLFAGGCSSGLQRTDLSKLARRDFSTIGFSMELPGQSGWEMLCDSPEYKKEYKSKESYFSIHPVYPGPLMEPLYLIRIRIVYLDKNEYASYQQRPRFGHIFKNTEFHKEITELKVMHPNGRIPLCCFRRDFKNEKTGDVILAAITYLDNFEGNMQYHDQDVEAIKQMLNSIRFLDEDSVKNNAKAEIKHEADRMPEVK